MTSNAFPWELDSPRWLEQATHRRLAVHTTEDQTFEGILRLAADDGLLLWNTEIPNPDGVPLQLGEVFVLREKVSFVQVLRM